MRTKKTIEDFDGWSGGEFCEVFSNFFPCTVEYEGLRYPTTENAFQAAKSLDPTFRQKLTTVGPGEAKRLGRRVELRPDWDEVKIAVMRDVLRSKFYQPEYRRVLLASGDAELIEGNVWHDNIWGDCRCPKCKGIQGRNVLGRLLMAIRTEIAAQIMTNRTKI